MTATVAWSETGVLPGLRDALRSLIGVRDEQETVWRLAESDVADGLTVVGKLRQLLDVAEVALVSEGMTRGLPTQDSWSPSDWVSRHEGKRAPAPDVRQVSRTVRVAKGRSRVPAVTEAFIAGELPLSKADQLVRFEAQVAPVADSQELAEAMAVLLEGARDGVIATGPEGRGPHERVPGLTDQELAMAITRTGRLLKPAPEQERDDRAAKAGRALYRFEGPSGMTTYRLILDPEGAAVIDGAVAALSAPVKGPDGELDDRTPAQRRADAVVEVVRRGVSSPGEAPSSDKAQMHVMIPLSTLLGQSPHGAATTMTGQVLAPSVARRMACDAGIIPVVLGGRGEILEMGRSVRLFTRG